MFPQIPQDRTLEFRKPDNYVRRMKLAVTH